MVPLQGLFLSPRRQASRRQDRSQGVLSQEVLFLELLEDRTLPARYCPGSTFTVNLLGDAGLGDNGSNSTGQSGGDIRYCITQAEQQVNVGSTIQFASTVFGTGARSPSSP